LLQKTLLKKTAKLQKHCQTNKSNKMPLVLCRGACLMPIRQLQLGDLGPFRDALSSNSSEINFNDLPACVEFLACHC